MPREEEMVPKDKYTLFDRKERKYRKGIHSECSLGVSWALGLEFLEEIANDWICRAAEMDESISTTQSTGLLRG